MSIVIETSNGRMEAQDHKEAQRLLRKDAKKQREQALASAAAYDQALLIARANAYSILEKKISGNVFPRGWRAITVGIAYGAKLKARESYSTRTEIECETAGGMATLDFHGAKPLATLVNGSGFHTLVWVEESDKVQCYAIGHHCGQTALAIVPGIGLDEFGRG